MPKTIGELKLHEVLELMAKHHVKCLKLADGSILRMSSSGFIYTENQILNQLSKEPLHPKDPLMNPMTEDEVLFWSAGGSEFKDIQGKEVPVPLTGEEPHHE